MKGQCQGKIWERTCGVLKRRTDSLKTQEREEREKREREKDKEPEKRCWLSPVLKTG